MLPQPIMPKRTFFIIEESLANGLAPGNLSGNDVGVTKLTPEQFAVVVREVELMIGEGERDETWRVLKMFADGRFNHTLEDFPSALQNEFRSMGSWREKITAFLPPPFARWGKTCLTSAESAR